MFFLFKKHIFPTEKLRLVFFIKLNALHAIYVHEVTD